MSLTMSASEKAIKQVAKIFTASERDEDGLRVYVQSGGCAGFQYGFKLDVAQPDDLIIEHTLGEQEVRFYIDSKSLTLLEGGVIDYKESLQGAQFFMRDLKVQGSCSCGVSFSN